MVYQPEETFEGTLDEWKENVRQTLRDSLDLLIQAFVAFGLNIEKYNSDQIFIYIYTMFWR